MTEHCPDHSQLMQDVGETKGMVKILVDGQKEFREAIQAVRDQLGVSNTEQSVQKTKLAPIFWALLIFGAVILTRVAERLILK